MAESSSFTPIQVYHSETASAIPSAVNLEVGELALNIADRKLYTKDSSDNIVEIAGIGSVDLGDLNDVDLTGLADGDVISYDSSTSTWVVSSAGGGVSTLAALTDTDVTGVADGDTLIYNSSTSNWEAAASGNITAGKHRYWRVTFGGLVFSGGGGAGTVNLTTLRLFENGQGFRNGRRWVKGNEVDYTGATISNFSHSASWSGILTGSGSTLISVTDDAQRKGFQVDFGAGNEKAISGIDFGVPSSSDSGRLNAVTFSYSDDGSTWVEASDVTAILERIGAADGPGDGANIINLDIPIPHVGNIGKDSTPDADTLFDLSVPTIPEVDTSGGGGTPAPFWTWNTTRQTTGFTAAADTYYAYCDNGLSITLPSSPPAGTVVGLATNGAITVVAGFLGNNLINGNTPTVSWGVGDPADETQSQHVLLCYVDGTYGWAVVGGEIKNLSS